MKRGNIISAFLALCLIGGAAQAALPDSGVYLGKDGVPIAEEDTAGPQLLSRAMLPHSAAVQNAMALLPHSAAASVAFTIDAYGQPSDAAILESSGSAVLDEYALASVQGWKFKPARRGKDAVSSSVRVPIRFISTMVAIPASADKRPMKPLPGSLRQILDRYPDGLSIPVDVDVDSSGRPSDPVPAETAEGAGVPGQITELQTYAADCVKDWTFTPARNPDGEAIPSRLRLSVTLP